MNISVWVVDRDLGVSRGYQYDDEDRIEDAEEVVKNDKDDNEEDNDENHNYAYFMHFQHVINAY